MAKRSSPENKQRTLDGDYGFGVDDWDYDKTLDNACTKAVQMLKTTPKRGILRSAGEGQQSQPGRKIRLSLNPEQEAKADLPYRANKDVGEEKPRVVKPVPEKPWMGRPLPEDQGASQTEAAEEKTPAPTAEFDPFTHIDRTYRAPTLYFPPGMDLGPRPIPENIDDYVTITVFETPDEELEGPIIIPADGQVNERFLDRYFRKIAKQEPVWAD